MRGEEEDYLAQMTSGLRDFSGNLLLLISEADLTAQEFQVRIAEDPEWGRLTSQQQTTWVRLTGTDHTFSNAKGLDAANNAILSWLQR